MPALAVLCALNWERISVGAFKASLAITGVGALLLAYLALRLEQEAPGDRLYPIGYWALVAAPIVCAIGGLAVSRLARPTVNVAILLALASFAAFLRPFDGPRGTYGADVQHMVNGRTVWVPINFAAKEEGHRFLLPGADVRGYPSDPSLTAADLAARYPLFAISVPMTAAVPDGHVLGQRLDIATRQTPAQIAAILRGQVFDYLFVREFLVEAGPHRESAQPATSPAR
jgi:hypothetical protein